MITSILSKIGLPVLLKFIQGSLANLSIDSAKKAVDALGDVSNAIAEKKISVEELKEANRHLEKLDDIDKETLIIINDTIRKEMQSEDRFVRSWRPFFGYAVSITWMATILSLCWCILSGNPNTPDIIMALVETTSLWGFALGVLGVSVVKRSSEKQTNSSLFNLPYVKGRQDFLGDLSLRKSGEVKQTSTTNRKEN